MIDHSPSRSGIFLLLAAALTSPCLAAAPPFLVEDINPATQEQRLPALHELRMVSLGGFVYFQGYDGQNGLELWRTDGTPLGTSLVRDICPGACSANPASLAVAGSRVFFTAEDGVHGRELWTSDGTAAGTSLVRDLRPGLIGSELGNLTGLGSKLLLVRLLPFPGLSREIWVSDGTTAGTFPLLTGIEASFAEATTFFLGEVGGRQLFVARDAAHGNELWATDGTVAGTALVKDIHPGTLSGITQVESAKGADGRIYFVAEDGAHGAELWASDGTAAGTVLFADLQPGSNADGPRLLTRFGSWIAFRLASPDYQVWRTDGTPGGTFPLTAQNEGIPMRLGWAGSHLFFFNEGGNQAGFWASDGTPEGTQRLLFEPSGAAGPWLFPVAGRMLFYWGAAGSGLEPWVSDGTAAGTQLLADIESGPSGSVYSHSGLGGPGDPRDLPALLGSRVFFGAFAGVEGNQLWASDGTPGGTALVADLDLETSSLLRVADLDVGERFDGQLTPLGAGILFKATDGVHGVEPWASQ
nr:hypothetical protein [Thermoanaerobaculia bacterium]